MNPPPVIIEPFITTTTTVTTSFRASCRNVNLYDNASFAVDTFDANNKMLNRQVLTMTTEQYKNWGNNDAYVNNFVADSLGFVIAGTTPPPEVTTPPPEVVTLPTDVVI